LWLDNQLIVEQWRDGGATTHTADVVLVDGAHHLKVEYYERGGEALLQLSWELLETYPDWKGEYFNNPNLSGAPVLVRNDLGINFGWGPNSPGPGVPADNFSARWTRTVYFAAGSYRFNVLVDDGTRLWIDDTKIIDQWRSGEPRTFSADVNLSEGNHRIRLEYFDYIYDAQVRLGWERLDHFPDWKAEYFDNRKLQGNPVIIRNETNIDHRWNHGSPGPGVPADNFSARWRRKADFQEGTYRFQVKVDDGVRLWVDDKQILDSWQDGQTRTFEVESRLSKGQHRIRIEYYERTGEARIEVSWKKVESPVNKPPQANPGGPYVVNEGSPITFDGRASYDPDGTVVHYEWDFDYGKGGFTVDAYGSTPSHSYADGPATFVVALRVTDEKGANHVATTQVIVQNVAPVVEAGGPYQGLVGNLITLSGAATDAGAKDQAGLTYLWDFGDGMSGAGPVVGHTYNQPNIYTAKLTVVDKDGGQSSDTAVVEVSKLNEPPVAKIVGPLTGTVGEKLIFDGSGSNDNDDKVVSYQWHFGDGTTANGISVEHSYDRAETFKVTLLVTDNQGLTSQADHLVQIEDIGGGNEAPLARITAPELAHAGQLVRFSGSGSSDPNGDLISYTWSFGDGSSGMGMEVEHSYVVTGTYQITLVVTDEAGLSGEATAFIHIGEVIHQAPVAGLAGSEAGQTGLSFNSSNSYRRTD
jgi:PKD repeat protein